MKKFLAAIALSLAMTGCTAGDDEPIATPGEQYVDALQERSDAFDNADEDKLVDAGKEVCDYFTTHGINQTSIVLLMDGFVDAFGLEDAAMVISESVEAFCPEKADDINSALGSERSA